MLLTVYLSIYLGKAFIFLESRGEKHCIQYQGGLVKDFLAERASKNSRNSLGKTYVVMPQSGKKLAKK